MTKASTERPTKRMMKSQYDDFVVELEETYIRIRPKGTRRGGTAEVAFHVGSLYQNALLSKRTFKKKGR